MNSLSTVFKSPNSSGFIQYLFTLPLFTAILIEAHVRFTSAKHHGIDHIWLSSAPSFIDYFLLIVHLSIQALPLFVALAWVLRESKSPSRSVLSIAMPLLLGFVAYPFLVYVAVDSSEWFARVNLLSLHFMGLVIGALGLWALVHFMNPARTEPKLITSTNSTTAQSDKLRSLLSTLFSLNSVVVICLFTWAFIISGAFHYHDDPMNNMPINLVFDPVQIVSDPLPFLNYFWQFSIISVVMGTLYLVNRYVLIKRVLNAYGVFYFVLASIVFWLLYTPIAGQLVIHLPMTPAHFTFIPSENFDVFDSDNYKVSLLFLFLTTPLILAFERQRDVAKTAEIAEQKTQAELQLLQQQINPHFLFNSMNSLYALTLKKSEQAPNFVMHLSNLLRYTVYEGQKPKVKLEQEIQYLQDYIALQNTRLGNRVKIKTTWPEPAPQESNLSEVEIAPLLFVVILENAFKHGAESQQGEAEIDVALTLTSTEQNSGEMALRFECCNSYDASAVQPKVNYGGVGLTNLKKRLALLYPNQHTYRVKSDPLNLESEHSSKPSDDRVIEVWRTELEITL